MINKLEITIDVIVHATENISKIFQSFKQIFNVEEEDFTITETTGYFENPIILINSRLIKKQAKIFMKNFLELLSTTQINELVEDIEKNTEDSKFYLRLDKQELINGKLIFSQKDTVKIKIHTPIYNKKDTRKIFSQVFESQLN
ncbi:MAG TPA: RNA-binding domain-containing protein [Nitrosopumilus sp.]|jgi:hypothetical protein|nr:RNA-binding domain-containing protein [Nitrosopumilus sp.]